MYRRNHASCSDGRPGRCRRARSGAGRAGKLAVYAFILGRIRRRVSISTLVTDSQVPTPPSLPVLMRGVESSQMIAVWSRPALGSPAATYAAPLLPETFSDLRSLATQVSQPGAGGANRTGTMIIQLAEGEQAGTPSRLITTITPDTGQGSGAVRTYPVLCGMQVIVEIARLMDAGMPPGHVGL